jgi:hypothetical protein
MEGLLMDFKVTITNFNDNTVVPNEFDTCLLVFDDGSTMIGHWDKSSYALAYDERGSFFDGIGGHIALKDIVAWKNLDDVMAEKV